MEQVVQGLGTGGVVVIAVVMLLNALGKFNQSKKNVSTMPSECRTTLGTLASSVNETKKIATETFFEHKGYLKNIADNQQKAVVCQEKTLTVLKDIKTAINGNRFS